jgi:hypothetical protein
MLFPHCRQTLAKRNRKCPECRQGIAWRDGNALTTEQAKEYDRQQVRERTAAASKWAAMEFENVMRLARDGIITGGRDSRNVRSAVMRLLLNAQRQTHFRNEAEA